MKKIYLIILLISFSLTNIQAQSAKYVLDKTATLLSSNKGISTEFAITNNDGSKIQGTISLKNKMFYIKSQLAHIWFDGKTQWTYIIDNEEVNVSNPTENELQAINPYNFINLYKKGYKYSIVTKANTHIVHLTTTNSTNPIKELYITVNKASFVPKNIRINRNSQWSTIDMWNFKNENYNDNYFRFNKTKYPDAEIIDLR